MNFKPGNEVKIIGKSVGDSLQFSYAYKKQQQGYRCTVTNIDYFTKYGKVIVVNGDFFLSKDLRHANLNMEIDSIFEDILQDFTSS